MIELSRKHTKRSMQNIKSGKQERECNNNIGLRNHGFDAIETKCKKFIQEVEILRALPQLDADQAKRLTRLEQIIANMQGTLQKVR